MIEWKTSEVSVDPGIKKEFVYAIAVPSSNIVEEFPHLLTAIVPGGAYNIVSLPVSRAEIDTMNNVQISSLISSAGKIAKCYAVENGTIRAASLMYKTVFMNQTDDYIVFGQLVA